METILYTDAKPLLSVFDDPTSITHLVIYKVRVRPTGSIYRYRLEAIRCNGYKSGGHFLRTPPWVGVRLVEW